VYSVSSMNNQVPSQSDTLAKDCKAFYEKRLALTHSVEHKWSHEAGAEPAFSDKDASIQQPFSKLPHQITRLRSELLSLAHLDNELFKNLLALNDKLEELKLQRDQDHFPGDHLGSSHEELRRSSGEETTDLNTSTSEEYDDDDIDEEVDDDNDGDFNLYSSLPPTQILEAAKAVDQQHLKSASTVSAENNSGASGGSGSGGLDVMGGLKFMLRSRSFLLRPPFHKKNSSSSQNSSHSHSATSSATLGRNTPRRSRITSSDSPFRTFDRITENIASPSVFDTAASNPQKSRSSSNRRSQSAERRQKKRGDMSKLEAGSSATLTRGFHLPHTSKSLWQRVFVGGGSSASSSNHSHNNNGPESLPCSWSIIDMEDKSPPPTLKHFKQNSFDSGIHNSDSSEYSIKV